MPILPIEPQRLYRQIADQLRALLIRGEFPPGTRLPAERDLAKQLGVSRPSVREALIALEVSGWVEVRVGSGVYALDRSLHHVTSVALPAAEAEWGPLELIRARRVIEGETAAIAAAMAKRKHIDAISRAITGMRELVERRMMPLEGDREFHLAVVDACGNTVLSETVQTFWESRRGPIFTRLGGHFETVKVWVSAIEEHEAVRDAIAEHDAPGARAAMHRHMDKAHQRFSASWRHAQSAEQH